VRSRSTPSARPPKGNSARLVQRVVRSPLHCDFTADESIAAFDALIDWDVNGTVPMGDDVLNHQVAADPAYGCTFTTATRTGMPACP
jgi:hypothetical protein